MVIANFMGLNLGECEIKKYNDFYHYMCFYNFTPNEKLLKTLNMIDEWFPLNKKCNLRITDDGELFIRFEKIEYKTKLIIKEFFMCNQTLEKINKEY